MSTYSDLSEIDNLISKNKIANFDFTLLTQDPDILDKFPNREELLEEVRKTLQCQKIPPSLPEKIQHKTKFSILGDRYRLH